MAIGPKDVRTFLGFAGISLTLVLGGTFLVSRQIAREAEEESRKEIITGKVIQEGYNNGNYIFTLLGGEGSQKKSHSFIIHRQSGLEYLSHIDQRINLGDEVRVKAVNDGREPYSIKNLEDIKSIQRSLENR